MQQLEKILNIPINTKVVTTISSKKVGTEGQAQVRQSQQTKVQLYKPVQIV
jgi:hypothetical protein